MTGPRRARGRHRRTDLLSKFANYLPCKFGSPVGSCGERKGHTRLAVFLFLLCGAQCCWRQNMGCFSGLDCFISYLRLFSSDFYTLSMAHATLPTKRISRAALSGRLSSPLSMILMMVWYGSKTFSGFADQAITDSHTSTSPTTPTSSPIYSTQDSRPGCVAMSRFGDKH